MIIREMILFSLLCLGALFFNSSEFVDTGIVPKWYMTITMGIVLVVYYLILSQRKRSFSFEMQGIIYAIIISLLCRHYMESYNIGECYNVLHLLG